MTHASTSKRLKRSLQKRIIRILLGVGSGMMLVALTTISLVLIDVLKEEMSAGLATKALHIKKEVNQRLTYLHDSVENISKNHFVINALVHPGGREVYLYKMVEDFSRLQSINALSVVDYAGNLVHSTLKAPPDYKKNTLFVAGARHRDLHDRS